MRIAIIDTTVGGEGIGGAHTFLPDLVSGLMGQNHELHLITDGEPNQKVREKIAATGVEIHTALWDPASLVEDAAPKLATWVNELAPDVFLISTSADIGWVVLPLLDPHIATLTIGHNDALAYYEPARHYRDFLTTAIGVSDEICANYQSESGLDKERVDWIPYGVRTSDVTLLDAGGPLKMVYVGRVEEDQKRFSDLVKVAKRLFADGVDLVFHIVGDGESMPQVRRELATEIAAGKVVLHGWLESDKVIDVVRESEVFVLASAYEGFCIALVEAMANGCAPVVTDIKSGNKQLVEDGVNGFVVPIGDIDAFVDKIKVLAADRAKLLEFRRRAWETGRQYSVERMVESYERCFETAIKDARENPRTPDPNFPLMASCRSKYPLWLRRLKAKAMSFANLA